ncbi:hypothetical protein [Pasteurella multocida]|uniref:hypothetical protein n=1 Tax=Pasteurella multocida TaxID=747 RepID=UPI002341921C|nr:hypothetical protein [Pasteurella multocida]MDC4236875.1 hypothetical protein [Pasteurella multocida]
MFNNKIKAKLENISIALFSQYLTSRNWTNPSNLKEVSLWYTPEKTDGLSLPLDENKEDKTNYIRHIWNALKDLSEIEKRNVDAIINDILARHEDKIYIRVQDESVKDGTIPLFDGVLLFENAKNLIHSIALSAKSPKVNYKANEGGKSVKDFMNNVRLGQTSIGSYVVELSYPVENIQSDQIENEEFSTSFSFSRGVTHNLLKSISKLKKTIENFNEDPTVFAKLITDGVSYNLCNALTQLSGAHKQRKVKIAIEAGDIIDPNISNNFSIEFNKNEINIIEIAAKYYLEEFTLPRANIIGKIVSNTSSDLEQGGFILLKTSIQNKNRVIRVDLNAQQYQIAVKAHSEGKKAQCTGTELHINKKKGRLQTLTSFMILS